jgi:hypothetical protein
MTPEQVRHLAVEQRVEAVVNYARVADVLGPSPPKPILEWAAYNADVSQSSGA